jgi:serine/threonine protein kinase
MSGHPDFYQHGYEIVRELGRNREGGRITWLAQNIDTCKEVVLKQFCFAQAGSSWSAFNAHEREIQILRGLNHPGIPSYLDSFSTNDGFCLVSEYINAPSLGECSSFSPEEIKQIAISLLEILVYLQNLIPPVIHRDIKPENILIDEEMQVYLIDFGMSRVGSEEVSGSSVFKGTPGFIPPEQMRKPTVATDLYGLGATLVCLLTGTKSTQIQDLTDDEDPYLINFKHLLPKLSLRFLDWLEKMVQPKLRDRFVDGKTALKALETLSIIRIPRVELSATKLFFQVSQLGDKVTRTVNISNSVSDTLLQGRWEVASHPQDPPHTPDSHSWITIQPGEVNSNNCDCRIQVDSSQLMADKVYERQLFLFTNAYPEMYILKIKVETAKIPLSERKLPYAALFCLFLISSIATIAGAAFVSSGGASWLFQWLFQLGVLGFKEAKWFFLIFVVFCVGASGHHKIANEHSTINEAASLILKELGIFLPFLPIMFITTGITYQILQLSRELFSNFAILGLFLHVIFAILTMFFNFFVLFKILGLYSTLDFELRFKLIPQIWSLIQKIPDNRFMTAIIFLTVGLGVSFAGGTITSFLNPSILLALTGTSLPLCAMLLYPPLKHRQLIANYRKSEAKLIKP